MLHNNAQLHSQHGMANLNIIHIIIIRFISMVDNVMLIVSQVLHYGASHTSHTVLCPTCLTHKVCRTRLTLASVPCVSRTNVSCKHVTIRLSMDSCYPQPNTNVSMGYNGLMCPMHCYDNWLIQQQYVT